MDYKELSRYLTGQWNEILTMYGIEIPQMKGKNSVNHSCPCCGGDDRAHWREIDGRLALYCRNCANEKMKSPEDVIMEVCSIDFRELYQNLLDYTGNTPIEHIKKAQIKAKSKPARNMPTDHKQDHEKSISFLEQCEVLNKFAIFNLSRVQYPYPLTGKNGYPIFPITNENGAIVNCACLSKTGLSYIAGGLSYAAWHTIPRCDVRETNGIAYCVDVIRAINHWYKTGQETRIVFNIYNLIWMLNVGLIDESKHTLVVEGVERAQLPYIDQTPRTSNELNTEFMEEFGKLADKAFSKYK